MFQDAEFINEDFTGSDLRRIDFSYSVFFNCDFSRCDFEKADFLGAEFRECRFTECVLNSYITGSRFEKCKFIDCSFDSAYIFRSGIIGCDLSCCSMNDTLLSTVNFDGTEFRNVRWKGTCINSPPLIIDGIEYPVVALDNGYMHVGCEFNTYDWFWNTDEKHSAAMEGLRARRFWKRNKQWIFDMLKARKLYDYTTG